LKVLKFRHVLSQLILLMFITACTLNSDENAIISTIPTNPPAEIVDATITPEDAIEASAWEVIAPGIEWRTYLPENIPFGDLIAVRIDPTQYQFRAHYREGNPLSLQGWRDELVNATVIINANFFDPENRILGLLVSDGVRYGASYIDRGGWFGIQNDQVFVRSNTIQPYQGETLEQAVQAFPMLVLDGVSIFNNSQGDRQTRRTLIAQDTQGRIILMITPLVGMSLVDLSAYLPTTDMNIVNAFNLDGGGSTMMFVDMGTESYTLRAFDSVPAVLAVYPR